jgi:peptidoglycan/xylan/chitin deacetylase (PgdA/CDA1 family)
LLFSFFSHLVPSHLPVSAARCALRSSPRRSSLCSGTVTLPHSRFSAAFVALAWCESFAYSSAKVQENYLALTFDDGPNRQLTPKLLDILKERNIKCTFFILGSLAERYPDIV